MKQARQFHDKQNKSGTFRGLSEIFSIIFRNIKTRLRIELIKNSKVNNHLEAITWRHELLRVIDIEGKGIRLESSQK